MRTPQRPPLGRQPPKQPQTSHPRTQAQSKAHQGASCAEVSRAKPQTSKCHEAARCTLSGSRCDGKLPPKGKGKGHTRVSHQPSPGKSTWGTTESSTISGSQGQGRHPSHLGLIFRHVQTQGACAQGPEARQTDREGRREPPELAEGGNKGSSGTEGNHRKTGSRNSLQLPASSGKLP